MIFRKGSLALGQDFISGPFGYEHADPPALVQDVFVHQQPHALGGGGGVDGVEPGQLVGAGDLLLDRKSVV